jgi:FtsZ-interacting cell division protein ZipA
MVGGYFRDMSNTTLIILIVVAIVVIVAIALVGYQMARRKRTDRLRDQYGPEYDRALEQSDSQREAESELRGRSKRQEKLELRSLDSSEREDFQRRWSDVQAQFVDDPKNAVHNADVLVVEVMSARGYPVQDFDQQADDLSVRYPEVTQRYRDARRVAQANEDGTVDTEDLRQAVTSYRALVLALLADDGDRSREDDGDRGRHDDVDPSRHDDVARSRQNDIQSEHDNNQMTERETKA